MVSNKFRCIKPNGFNHFPVARRFKSSEKSTDMIVINMSKYHQIKVLILGFQLVEDFAKIAFHTLLGAVSESASIAAVNKKVKRFIRPVMRD
ncbi:hypothetical protein D3C77_294690 [compost metagenome]